MGQLKVNNRLPLVDVEQGRNTVTVKGVDVRETIEPGAWFSVLDEAVAYQVASEPQYDGSNSTITLAEPYGGETKPDVPGVLHWDFTSLGLPLMRRGDVNTPVLWSRAMQRINEELVALWERV